MKNKTSKIEKLYDVLAEGKNVTTRQLQKALKTKNVSAFIATARREGAKIWTNRVSQNGKRVVAYRYDNQRSFL